MHLRRITDRLSVSFIVEHLSCPNAKIPWGENPDDGMSLLHCSVDYNNLHVHIYCTMYIKSKATQVLSACQM